MGGWIIEKGMNERVDEWKDGGMDGQREREMDRYIQMDGWTDNRPGLHTAAEGLLR